MKSQRSIFSCALVMALCLSIITPAAGPQFKFRLAGEFPGAPQTVPLQNNLHQVVGYYNISPGGQFGYMETGLKLSRTPSFTSLQPPGGWFSFTSGINDAGAIVGGYCVQPQQCVYPETMHGYSYADGKYTTIDFPGAMSTGAYGINDSGQIVGGFCLSISPCGRTLIPTDHAFLDSGGAFMQLDYPGAQSTQAMAVNSAGTIVGFYDTSLGGPHGFLYQNGRYKNIDFPGALSTHPGSINDGGTVAGYYELPTSQVLGFIYR